MAKRDWNNLELADLLDSVAAAYKIKNPPGSKFKIIAYERAADAVEHLSSEAKDIWDEGKLEEVAGIGKSIASHLDELFRTGRSKHFEEVKEGIPDSVFEMMKVPGIGPKSAFQIAKDLHIGSAKTAIQDLKKAAEAGKIAGLENFGSDSESSILQSVKEYQAKPPERMHINKAETLAMEVIDWLKKSPEVERADPLGSLRRRAATVGDIDISASSHDPEKALEYFTKYPHASRTLEKGERTASIIVPGNIQVDLMVEHPDSYGALLQHFTGSKHHNIALRDLALKKGLSISDYGVRKKGSTVKKYKSIKTEEDLYRLLGMDWIPPELREDTGEIERAVTHKLPNLVELSAIKGDLHMHSKFNIETSHDLGQSSMIEHIKVAEDLGYEYIAFTEHNPSQTGHKEKDIISLISKKKAKIEQLKSRVKIFNSLEIDILPDGGLPVPDEGMELLDFALVSVHSSFKQSKSDMTKRVLSALAHPKVKIFAHPTTRIINKREGVEFDWPKIFEFCAKNNKWLEINASVGRLDLPDFLVKEAIAAGVKLTLGTDSHHIDEMSQMKYGVDVARRGWAEEKNIINTLSAKAFQNLL